MVYCSTTVVCLECSELGKRKMNHSTENNNLSRALEPVTSKIQTTEPDCLSHDIHIQQMYELPARNQPERMIVMNFHDCLS